MEKQILKAAYNDLSTYLDDKEIEQALNTAKEHINGPKHIIFKKCE